MGTYVCLELAHWLQREGAPLPLGLMLAAGSAPHHRKRLRRHLLPEADFIAELQGYGGTPPQVFAHRELIELVLPVLRADFEMVDEYDRAPEPRLPVPLAIWGGEQDCSVPLPAIEGWRDHTTASVEIALLPGGHFFLNSAGEQLREGVERTLRQWVLGKA